MSVNFNYICKESCIKIQKNLIVFKRYGLRLIRVVKCAKYKKLLDFKSKIVNNIAILCRYAYI